MYQLILLRDAYSGLCCRNASVGPSVRLSITLPYRAKMAERIVKIFSLADILIISDI